MACSVYRTMKDFDLRDLDAFVAVARTRNFRRAALEQRVSVSSLSQRLRDMEERLGVRLMNRTTRSVALTEAGELLLAASAPAMHGCRRGARSGARPARRAVGPPAHQRAAAGDRSGAGADGRAVSRRRIRKIDLEIVGDSAFVDIVAPGLRRRRALWRASGAGHDRGLARPAAALRGGGVAANMSRSMAGRNIRRICSITPASASASAAARCWTGNSRRPAASSRCRRRPKLIATYPGLAMRAAHDGVGFWLTFEGYVRDGIKSARWSACSTTGARRFRDRFCITQAGASRRRRSPRSWPLSRNGASRSGGRAKNRPSSRPSEARAGTHNQCCLSEELEPSCRTAKAVVMGPCFRGDDDVPHSMLGSTRSGGLWLSRKVRMLMITFSPISTRPSIVAEPICGSSVTLPALASRTSFGLTAGSCS